MGPPKLLISECGDKSDCLPYSMYDGQANGPERTMTVLGSAQTAADPPSLPLHVGTLHCSWFLQVDLTQLIPSDDSRTGSFLDHPRCIAYRLQRP